MANEPENRSLDEGGIAPAPSGPTWYQTEAVSLRDMPAAPNATPESRLGERARYARNDLNLNIEALSRLTKEYDTLGNGLSPTSIARYESSESLPGIREFRILCETLEVPLEWLLYGKVTDDIDRPLVTEGEKFILLGLRTIMAAKKDDFTLEPTDEDRERLRTEIRNAKLAKARKPQIE